MICPCERTRTFTDHTTMSAWGNRSSSPLLTRIRDDGLTTLTLLPGKTFTANNERTTCGLFNQLETVQLSGKKCHSPSAVGRALGAAGCSVATLKLGDSTFSDDDLSSLVSGAASNTSLTSLDLSAKSLASLSPLTCFGSLLSLDVSRNAGLRSVSELPPSLVDLDVSECGDVSLSAPFPKRVAARDNGSAGWTPAAAVECEGLDLSGVKLPREHVVACLASESLVSLKLRGCGLAAGGAEGKLEACAGSRLRSLDVSGNPGALAGGGLLALVRSLPKSCDELDLSDMGMGEEGVVGADAKALVAAAVGREGLRKLRLFGNRIANVSDADAVVDAICDALPGCGLEELDLGGKSEANISPFSAKINIFLSLTLTPPSSFFKATNSARRR